MILTRRGVDAGGSAEEEMGSRARVAALVTAALVGVATAAGCAPGPAADSARIQAVAAENQYADVIAQVGGDRVQVTAVMSNPNADPHTFEASAQVARAVGDAQLVVQNGLGYDAFMDQIEAATPSSTRHVIDVQELLGLPGSTADPHLWYGPATMPRVAAAIAADLGAIDPGQAATFRANAGRFDSSLAGWTRAIAELRSRFPGAPVATTEPVGDRLLRAAGLEDLTPWSFQADLMNGVDPSAQDVTLEQQLLTGHRVRVLLYNRQVTDTITESLLQLALSEGVPVVALYETMPTPGYHYQSWMLAEATALERALAEGRSTTRL
jgi:zinc/manganese transport system substrate-binding protein